MEDREILQLFNARDEAAISESRRKFGPLILALALRLLRSKEDAEETENDTYLKVWNAVPPAQPLPLAPYFSAVCRRTALDRLRTRARAKRGSGVYEESLSELAEAIPDGDDGRTYADTVALKNALNAFLSALTPDARQIFLRRYWWFSSVKEIASACGMTEGAVKMSLSRTRAKLKDYLKEEQLYDTE
ncbi:MAG: sigma-70 family RNA polymerase sigma factor [Clostridia bacterium]|nr:sigma-70 family RNA polymerase sigma factor [Clostridia bacterium]